jgi:hypothetical protein
LQINRVGLRVPNIELVGNAFVRLKALDSQHSQLIANAFPNVFPSW